MIKLIYKLSILALLATLLCTIAVRSPIRQKFGLSLMANKFQILKSKSKSKKIVFVGGSGLLGGLDSKIIANKLNYEVVNLGMFAGYGIPFLLNEAKYSLKEGDIVVIVPEYWVLYSDLWWARNPNAVKSLLLFASPKSIFEVYYDNANYKYIIRYCSELIIDKMEALCAAMLANNISIIKGIGIINSEKIINMYGDCIHVIGKKISYNKFVDYSMDLPIEYDYKSRVTSLNSFSNWCDNNGVKVFFVFSCLPTEFYDRNKKTINNLHNYLLTNSNIKPICDPKSMTFESKYFMDTLNHLDHNGKDLRTKMLLQYLSPHVTAIP